MRESKESDLGSRRNPRTLGKRKAYSMKAKQEVKESQGAEKEGQPGRKKRGCFPHRTRDWDWVTGEVGGRMLFKGQG